MIEIRLGSATDAPAIARIRRDSWYAAYEGIIPTPIIDRATAFGGAAANPPPYRRTLVAEAGEQPIVIGYASFGPERTVTTAPPQWSSAVSGKRIRTVAAGDPSDAPGAPGASGASHPTPSDAAVAPGASPSIAGRAPSTNPPIAGRAPGTNSLVAGSAPAGSPLTPDGLAGLVGELYALYVSPDWWSAGAGRALMDRVLASLAAERYQRAVLWVLADNARARRFYERVGFAPDGGTNILTSLGGVLELRYARAL